MIRIGISSTESRRELFMDNLNQNGGPCTSTVAAQIMAQNRQLAQKYYGPLFGKQIFTIVAVNPDPKWKENTRSEEHTSELQSL